MNNRLQHVGILGMRWGRRKGKISVTKEDKRSEDYKKAKVLKKKKISEMSNEELKAFATRMQLEKQYKDLNMSSVAKGQKEVFEILSAAGKQTATTLVAAQMLKQAERLIGAAKK